MNCKLAEGRLLSGFIYGDNHTAEYVYFPGSELDALHPLAVYETGGNRRDVTMEEALSLIEKRSLKPVKHPILGARSM